MSRPSGKTWGGADKIIENGESGLRKAASTTPGLNRLREGLSNMCTILTEIV